MKTQRLKIALTLLAIIGLTIFATAQNGERITQSGISISLYQDVKLATMKDNYGNKPFTPDLRFEFMFNPFSNDGKKGHIEIGGVFEYAKLSEMEFTRYGFQGGYNFTDYNFFNLFEYNWKLLAGAGVINRGLIENGDTNGFMSLELTLEYEFMITNNLSVNLKNTLMQRGDLEVYRSKEASYRPWDWKPNVYLGVTYRIGISSSYKNAGKK